MDNVPVQVVRYKCDFCRKVYVRKASATKHEKTCFFNPGNRSCVTCGWSFDPDYSTVEYCLKMNRAIFQKGERVLGCEGWEPKIKKAE